MNPIPFKYLETYEITSLGQLLSMITVVDEATRIHDEYLYEQDMLVEKYGAYAPVDPSFLFLEDEEPEPMEGGHEYDSEVIPF